MDHLLNDIAFEDIPAVLGGGLQLYNEPYVFNISSEGPLSYLGCEEDSIPFVEKRIEFEEKVRLSGNYYCYYYNGVTPSDSIYAAPDSSSVRIAADKKTSTSVNIDTSSVVSSDKEEVSALPLDSYSLSTISPTDFSSHLTSSENTFFISSPVRDTFPEIPEKTLIGFLRFFFIHHCFQQNPFLSCIAVCLMGFIAMFHPNLTRFFVPTLVVSILFVIAVSER
jgi:hypothetical protein